MPDLTVSLVIKDPATNSELMSLTDRPLADDQSSKAAQDFYKELYKEALNNYRFFGTLRGQITWPPATIISAAIALFAKQGDAPPNPQRAFNRISVALTVVLGLIFIANYYFQAQQRLNLLVGKEAHMLLIESYKRPLAQLKSHSEISKRVAKWYGYLIPDMPTVALGFFLVSIFYITMLFLSVLWKVTSGWLWNPAF